MSWAAEQDEAFLQLAAEFDHTATWAPAQGGPGTVAEPVLFNAPSKGLALDAPGGGLDTRLDYQDFVLTARAAAFPGLKASVDSGTAEEVDIEESGLPVGRYHVRTVRYIGDGRRIEARLSEVRPHAQSHRGRLDPAVARLLAGDG